MTHHEAAVAEIFARPARGIKLGLENITRALHAIGNPQNTFRIIHVAGTNGKGSVCAFCAAIAQAAGYKTGLYTSPHLVDFEERFIIDGVPVSGEKWLAVWNDCKSVADECHLSFFEIATLIAFELFRREGVGFAVIETGLGGRLDATNVVSPSVSVITRIGIDHVEYLGDDLLTIAGEKLGIVKHGIPVVIAPQDDPAVNEKAAAVCSSRGAAIHEVFEDGSGVYDPATGYATICIETNDVVLPLPGSYQIANAQAALAAAKLCITQDPFVLKSGIAKAFLPARFQTLAHNGSTYVFDVGHNPQAAKTFVKMVKGRFENRRIVIVTGIMADKDFGAMMKTYASAAPVIICTHPGTLRAADPVTLAASLPQSSQCRVIVEPDLEDALTIARAEGEVLCVCGSFYTVGAAMHTLQIKPYQC